MSAGSIRKVIWAVDAFQDDAATERHVLPALQGLIKGSKARIEPVYVLSPEQLNLPLEFSPPWVEAYRPAAERSLATRMHSLGARGLSKPRVLVQREPSATRAVKALASYAMGEGADMIAVATHGRKGLARAVMGSFAETLLLHSRVPVLVVGPKAKTKGEIRHILFPTDFGKDARPLFRRVVELAKGLGAKVTLYHAVQNPMEPVLQSGVYLVGGGWMPVSGFVNEQAARQRKRAEHWAALARKQGVPAEVMIEKNSSGVVGSIHELVRKRHVDLVAMAAKSGPVASAVIGSLTRQVVREATCPVWVLRAKK